jgi:hypothetical protein
MEKYKSLEAIIRGIAEGSISQGKTVGTRSSAFRTQSSSSSSEGIDVGARKNTAQEKASVLASQKSEHDKQKEIARRKQEAEKRASDSKITYEESEPSIGTKERIKVKAVARPDDAEPTSPKSTLAKTTAIKTRIIDEGENFMFSDKQFGLTSGLIAATRSVMERKEAIEKAEKKEVKKDDKKKNPFAAFKKSDDDDDDKDDADDDSKTSDKKKDDDVDDTGTVDAKKMKGGKTTKIDLEPKTKDKIDESMRLIKKHENGNKTAKVYKDNEWDEYRVKHYTGGKHHSDADYHTDDVDDAHASAKKFIKEDKKLSPKQMKIARLAGDPKKIDAEDFKKLRKEEIISDEEQARLDEIANSFKVE